LVAGSLQALSQETKDTEAQQKGAGLRENGDHNQVKRQEGRNKTKRSQKEQKNETERKNKRRERREHNERKMKQ